MSHVVVNSKGAAVPKEGTVLINLNTIHLCGDEQFAEEFVPRNR